MTVKPANNNYSLLLKKSSIPHHNKTMVVMAINPNKIQVGAISLPLNNKEDGEINLQIKVGIKIKDMDIIQIRVGEISLKIKDGINQTLHKDGDSHLNKIKVVGVISNKTTKKTGVATVDGDKCLFFFILNLCYF